MFGSWEACSRTTGTGKVAGIAVVPMLLQVITMVSVEHGSYISRVAMHAADFLGTYAGQVKVGGDIKCKCVCNYARGFRSKKQNSSKGIYVMHRRRPVKPPCLHEPKQHRKGDILANGASTCACIAKLNAQTSSSSGYNRKQKQQKQKTKSNRTRPLKTYVTAP